MGQMKWTQKIYEPDLYDMDPSLWSISQLMDELQEIIQIRYKSHLSIEQRARAVWLAHTLSAHVEELGNGGL